MAVHIGTSGWSYPHWDGVLYPPGMPAARRLAVYADRFDTVELNASFYRWTRETAFVSWRRRLPDGFRLTVKAPRGLTHAKKLYQPEVWIDRIAACWHALGDRRGVLLVQLAPSHARDEERLDYFLRRLPNWIPMAAEFRHASWHDDAVFELLARHSAAYCVMSGARLPCILRATAEVVYVRLHGPDPEHLYGGSYSDADLTWWADRLREWHAGGHDVWVYFNNDDHGHVVRNADRRRALVRG